ncbi:MAG: hypothetical protein OIF56_09755 [Cohaesibacter sp.]|nr:hypothetical protein [Cohaesibacter sp.]
MSEFVSTATMRDDKGKLVFLRTRRETATRTTQARKAASRFWGGVANGRGWELDCLYCVKRGASGGFVVSERRTDRRDWLTYIAAEKPSPQINACITELGGPLPDQPPPQSLTINGWTYHRSTYVGKNGRKETIVHNF